MTYVIFGIVLMCILFVIVTLFFKPYDYGASVAKFKKIGTDEEPSTDTQWRSVKIRPGLIACDRVTSLAGQVFLSKEAPELPLPNCTERDCRCHYVFLDDRRSGIDRRSELEQLEQYPASSEGDRRSSPGRRFDDPLPA